MRIIERLKKHDRNNIEIKYTFPVPEKRRKVDYEVEMYLFVPETLGINKNSYTDKQFYHDERNNIRLKTPQFLLKNMVQGPESPLAKLKDSMETLVAEPSTGKVAENCLRNIRIYCYVLKSALRDGCAFIVNQSEPEERERLISNISDDTREALKAFREAGQIIRVPGMADKIYEMFCLADEYNTMLTGKYLFKLLKYASKHARKAMPPLASLLEDEITYCKHRKFPIASAEGSNEELLYRMNVLKKIMGKALFIKTLTRTEGRFLGHIIPGIAAGIAVSIATMLLYLTRQNIKEFTATLFLFIVGIYIVKDRLKDWSKFLFSQYAGRFLYDFKTLLLTNNGKRIGSRRENFQFIKLDNLPVDISKLRKHDSSGGIESGRSKEQVLHTRRRIQLYSKNCRKLLKDFQVDGIHDIVRFNLRRFFAGMDNPEKKLFVLKDGAAEPVTGRRVYHLNMILRFSSDNIDELRRFRLVVSRDGIERIEEVS
jgi:hypothetical protein